MLYLRPVIIMANYNDAAADLSNDYLNPTMIELTQGSNVVTGETKGANRIAEDPDFFTFEVPEGFFVSNIVLDAYQWGDGDQTREKYGDSYFALAPGDAFKSTTDDSTFLVSKTIDDFVAEGSEVGQDLLDPTVGAAYGDRAGTGELGSGIYRGHR